MCAWARRIERGLRRQRAARVARLRAVIAWRPLSEQARAPYVRKRTLRKDRRGGSCAPHTSAAAPPPRPPPARAALKSDTLIVLEATKALDTLAVPDTAIVVGARDIERALRDTSMLVGWCRDVSARIGRMVGLCSG